MIMIRARQDRFQIALILHTAVPLQDKPVPESPWYGHGCAGIGRDLAHVLPCPF